MTTKASDKNQNGNPETVQRIEGEETSEITLELSQGKTDLLVSTRSDSDDEKFAFASLTRDELWEHVHNCLDMLTRMPRENK